MTEIPGTIWASRIREGRDYLGVTIAQAAKALGMEPAELERIEAGGATMTGERLRKMSRLYCRPVAWFSNESRFEPSPDLLHKLEGLTDHDREAVLDFAEWLQGAGPAPKITREQLEASPDA